MAQTQTSAMVRLVQQLSRLPGIGRRSAERMAFHLLKQPAEEALQLAAAISDLKTNVRHCPRCYNLTERDLCDVCSDVRRDAAQVLVVEQPSDVTTLETTGMYRGVYHVLMGRLSPLEGIGAGELNIESLLTRVRQGQIREVILGLNPNLEGDGTSLYLAQQLARQGVKVSRLARGLPAGASLETVSKAVLSDALEGRQEIKGHD